MQEIIETIINSWDPLGLLPYSPKDEYEKEVRSICKLLSETKDVSVLASGIYHIFIADFGKDIFDKKIDDCIPIAESIICEIGKGNEI